MNSDKILALDCSMRLTGAALTEGSRVVLSEARDLGRRQAAELPLMADRLLSRAGWAFSDIGLLAVTNGPGYFTGIRVGVSYAAALAYGLGVKIVPVGSLQLLALSSGREGPLLAVVYAGRGFVYAASFGCKEDLPVGEYAVPDLAEWRKAHPEAEAVSDNPERARETAGLDFPLLAVRPDPAQAALWADRKRELALDPARLRAVYCRAPQGVTP